MNNTELTEEQLDVQFYYITLLKKGAVLSGRLPIIWAKRFPTSDELLRFNLYCEDKLNDIVFGSEEDFEPEVYQYLDLLEEYFESKGINYYQWRDDFRAAITKEREDRVAYYQAKLDALPKYPSEETGLTLPVTLREELIALESERPGEFAFTKDALYPGRFFYQSQLYSFEDKLTRIKKADSNKLS